MTTMLTHLLSLKVPPGHDKDIHIKLVQFYFTTSAFQFYNIKCVSNRVGCVGLEV